MGNSPKASSPPVECSVLKSQIFPLTDSEDVYCGLIIIRKGLAFVDFVGYFDT